MYPSDEGEFMLADWLNDLERQGWTWGDCNICDGCGVLISPDKSFSICTGCNSLWMVELAEYLEKDTQEARNV